MSSPPLRLWSGQTLHKRFFPFEREFRYALVLIDVDIDRLEEAGRMSRLFAVNRTGLFSFHEADHGGPERTTGLRAWADDLFATAGVSLHGGMIRLVTFPRHFFYKFAPLSLWYGFGKNGSLEGIIYEVRNTFGERHCYVARAEGERSVHFADKSFHVSPFFDVSGQYRFTLREPASTLDVVVENIKDGSRTHLANIKARMLPATTSNFLSLALKNPMSTLGVTFGIHWQALLLWIRGAKYFSKPLKPERTTTVAVSVKARAAIAPESRP
ncbi:DUF1365 domain-containing protein [Hyphomonas sp.]|uniref:DUF1365 domain-containing protein n=1 Tax=Hyphomonas sp. TaxID=87 RepID=UPI0025BA930B|nr:DUF1365 domain-containing protein [Hyphomonas sp.]